MTRRSTNDTRVRRQLAAAFATPSGPMLDRLIGVLDELARRAPVTRLAALLALRALARWPLAWIVQEAA